MVRGGRSSGIVPLAAIPFKVNPVPVAFSSDENRIIVNVGGVTVQ